MHKVGNHMRGGNANLNIEEQRKADEEAEIKIYQRR